MCSSGAGPWKPLLSPYASSGPLPPTVIPASQHSSCPPPPPFLQPSFVVMLFPLAPTTPALQELTSHSSLWSAPRLCPVQLTIPVGLKKNNSSNAKSPARGRAGKVVSGEGTSAFLPSLCQLLTWDYYSGEETNPQRVQCPTGKTEAVIAGECGKE